MAESQNSTDCGFIKILAVPQRDFQIVIYRNETGNFTFAKRWWDVSSGEYGKLGPACGLYGSLETAEKEAKQKLR